MTSEAGRKQRNGNDALIAAMSGEHGAGFGAAQFPLSTAYALATWIAAGGRRVGHHLDRFSESLNPDLPVEQ